MQSLNQTLSIGVNLSFNWLLKLLQFFCNWPSFINSKTHCFIFKRRYSFLLKFCCYFMKGIIDFVAFKNSFHFFSEFVCLFNLNSRNLLIKCGQKLSENVFAKFFIIFRWNFLCVLMSMFLKIWDCLFRKRFSLFTKVWNLSVLWKIH